MSDDVAITDSVRQTKRNKLDQWLRHPLVVAAFTLAVGSGFLSWVTERAKNIETRKAKSVSYLETRIDGFNEVLTAIFGYLHDPKRRSCKQFDLLDEKCTCLFVGRLGNEINSVYLLNHANYSDDYDDLIWEIHDLIRLIEEIKEAADSEKTTKLESAKSSAKERVAKLASNWNIKPREGRNNGAWKEFDSWAMLIWDRTKHVHIDRLEAVVGK